MDGVQQRTWKERLASVVLAAMLGLERLFDDITAGVGGKASQEQELDFLRSELARVSVDLTLKNHLIEHLQKRVDVLERGPFVVPPGYIPPGGALF